MDKDLLTIKENLKIQEKITELKKGPDGPLSIY
jgi:hypothetical protein